MAARFRFRLEALLRVRKSLEEEAKRRLSRVLAQRDQAERHIAGLKEDIRRAVEGRRTEPGQAVDLERLRGIERWLLVLGKRLEQAEIALLQLQRKVAEARQALVKAHQDHLILERLKERRLEQHAAEVLREEMRDLDEIAVLRHHITHPSASQS